MIQNNLLTIKAFLSIIYVLSFSPKKL